MCSHVPALSCIPASESSFPPKGSLNKHRTTDVPSPLDQGGLLSSLSEDIGVVIELDPDSPMYVGKEDEPNLEKADVLLPAAVHQLLSRKECCKPLKQLMLL